MTIIIHLHQSHYRDFKNYYLYHVCRHLKDYFPELLSYTRFLGMTASVVVPMCSYLTVFFKLVVQIFRLSGVIFAAILVIFWSFRVQCNKTCRLPVPGVPRPA